MLRSLFLMLFIVAFSNLSFAQVRATTESGNKVLLYDNGTWKYEEKSVSTSDPSVPIVESAVVAAIAIDSSQSIVTESNDLFYLPSPRLVKYFGEARGNIRCKVSCSNTLGVVKIHFVFEIPVADGDRYFGWFKEGSLVTFSMNDGQKIELTMGDEVDVKRYEKTNYSTIANVSTPLTNTQLAALTSQPFRKINVGWKKKSEDYEVETSRFLMDLLPTVF